jgi:hypothetical protein
VLEHLAQVPHVEIAATRRALHELLGLILWLAADALALDLPASDWWFFSLIGWRVRLSIGKGLPIAPLTIS